MTNMAQPTTLLLLLATSCAKSLDPGDKDDTDSGSDVSTGEAVINATSQTDWVYLDLESSTMVAPATPEDSTEWDLGFRRYKVMINGGVSGTGEMEAVPMPAVARAPALQWVRIVQPSSIRAAPCSPMDRQAAWSSR